MIPDRGAARPDGERDRPPGTVEVVRLVARREVVERLRAKSYYIFTGLLVLGVLAIGVVNRLAGDDGPGTIEVGLAQPAPEDLGPAIAAAAATVGREATTTSFDDAASARAAVEDDEVDVAVVAEERQVVFAEDVDDQVLAIVRQAWSASSVQQALLDAGLTPAEANEVLSPAPLEATTLEGGSADTSTAVLVGTITSVLLFLSLQTFGGYVLTGVVEEKSSAVIEVLLVRARPDQLLAGKVLGIGVAALLQFTLAIAAGATALVLSGVDVPGEIWSSLPLALVWFVGGYVLYSTLFALAGSLVSRQEDAQAASAPILTVLVAAYMLVFIFGYVPESTASRVMSIIPPLAPFLMPMRMAAGAASVVEVVVALVLLAATTVGVWKLAGKIYEQVLLRRGSRISWGDALSLVRRG